MCMILSDGTKFQRATRNTVENLKKKINSLVTAANAHNGGIKFETVIGDYEAGYFYGNVKTHKDGNPANSYSVVCIVEEVD